MSARSRRDDSEFGSDSFLDVVANVVGILIILVMVAGLRVQNAPVDTSDTPPIDLSEPLRLAASLQREVLELATQSGLLDRELLAASADQSRLAKEIAAEEQSLARRRQQLDAAAQERFDLEQRLAAAQSQAEQLQQQIAAEVTGQKTVTIESYPTAISRTVEGKEAHFQLRGGRVVFIPIEDLLTRLKADAPQHFWKLKDLPEATSVVGPVDGFRLRYGMERIEMPFNEDLPGRRVVGYQLSSWTLIPVSSQLGETLDEAQGETSHFRAALSVLNPRQTTVTLWTYPDSFAMYRQLKKELYLLGFATAGRPLPDGTPIAGSPKGSRSAAQ